MFSWGPPLSGPPLTLLILRDYQVVEIRAELRVDEEARRPLTVADRVGHVDHPLGRLRRADRPRLAARPHLAVGQVLDAQLQPIPRVGLPRERRRLRPRRLRLP